VPAEIQLLTCGYSAPCTVRGCGTRAIKLARYADSQGRPLKQRELAGDTRTGSRRIARTSRI
jgi:hypothetical protein